MIKIIVAQNLDLFPDQVERLNQLGQVKIYEDVAESPDDWLNRCLGFDVVCTGSFGLRQKIYDLKDVFISLPLVNTGWMDKEKLRERNIKVANSPGCNKDAVSEWIIGMMINMLRDLPEQINGTTTGNYSLPKRTVGIFGKNVCILGAGNIGNKVGEICAAFGMKINFFRQGDSLIDSVKDADIVINCLGLNETTKGILSGKFFSSFRNGSYFISVTSPKIYDAEALLSLVGKNIAGAAIDAGDARVGDTNDEFYKRILKNKNVMATPHIAFNTDVTARVANDMMIGNIEAFLSGAPINLIS